MEARGCHATVLMTDASQAAGLLSDTLGPVQAPVLDPSCLYSALVGIKGPSVRSQLLVPGSETARVGTMQVYRIGTVQVYRVGTVQVFTRCTALAVPVGPGTPGTLPKTWWRMQHACTL